MWSRLSSGLTARGPIFLAAAFACIIAVIGSALLLLDAQRLRSATYDEAEHNGEVLFSTIGQQISDSLYFDDIEQIRKDAESLILQQEITRIAVFTIEGKYLLDTDQYKVPQGGIEPDLVSLVRNQIEPLYRMNTNKLQFIGSIGFDGGSLGGLYFELDLSRRLELVDEAIRERSVWGLLIVLLTSGLGLAIATASGTARSLRAIESNYQELIEQSPLPNAVFTSDGDLRYANPAFVRLMGRSRHFSENNYQIFNDPGLLKDTVMESIKRGFKEGLVDIPMFHYPMDGDRNSNSDRLWIRAVVFPLRDQAGQISEVVVTFQDVSAEKQAEEERERLNARLLQSQKLEGLGVMAGGIAHDLNNYLTPIQGYGDLLSRKLSEDLKPFADNIMKSAGRAAELCSQLLAYAGRDTQVKKIADISDEVRQMSELLRTSLSKKATLTQSLARDLPLIMVDQIQLRQILQNLIINASEALEEEVGEISLSTGALRLSEDVAQNLLPAQHRPAGDYVYVEVADTGVGMTAEIVENIFNPFYSTKFTGRGLGLSAVLGIVSNHEGGIVVESKPDSGTAFTIYFPAAKTLQVDSTVASNQERDRGLYSGEVLLVDDEEDVLMVGRHILESLGFQVTVARNGAHALDEFRKNPGIFRCIVLDLMMPVMDGESALEAIRNIDQNIPIIVVTGYSGTDSTVRLTLKPNVTVLAKPYLINDMVNVLATIFPAQR
jgi:two-component system cell cycle sensor histidine kinase/response regulator CckA